MRRTKRALRLLPPALAVSALLAGCSDLYWDRRDSIAFNAGNANAANLVAQEIDPWPAVAANKNIDFNGERMQRAIERYRTNKVIPPQGTNTSSVQYQPVIPMAPASSGNGSP
jgi:hypothetical protein